MTHSSASQRRSLFAVTAVTLSILTACNTATAPAVPSPTDHAAAETYIRAHVNDLSPRTPVLGGTWHVTDIVWQADGSALVSYEDGHVALSGLTTVSDDGGNVTASGFTNIMADGGGSSEGPAAKLSKEGETCGGIAGLQCEPSLFCTYDGAYPDAAGTCVK